LCFNGSPALAAQVQVKRMIERISGWCDHQAAAECFYDAGGEVVEHAAVNEQGQRIP